MKSKPRGNSSAPVHMESPTHEQSAVRKCCCSAAAGLRAAVRTAQALTAEHKGAQGFLTKLAKPQEQ